jgi:hypothetical protein
MVEVEEALSGSGIHHFGRAAPAELPHQVNPVVTFFKTNLCSPAHYPTIPVGGHLLLGNII